MIRTVQVRFAWIALAVAFAVPRVYGASTPESEAIKQIKARLKLATANVKANSGAVLQTFNTDADVLLDDINDGSVPSISSVLADLDAAIMKAVLSVYDLEQLEVVFTVQDGNNACATNSVDPPEGFRNGDFGAVDKFIEAVHKENAKLRKKILAKVKKIRAALGKQSSGALGLNAVIREIPFSFQARYTQSASNFFQTNEVVFSSLVAGHDNGGPSSGIVIASGLADASDLDVSLLSGPTNTVSPSSGAWSTTFNSVLTTGTQVIRVKENAGGDVVAGESIGTPP